MFLATVATYNETYAIADSEARAKKVALKSALEYLKRNGTAREYGYKTLNDVEEALGCFVVEIPPNTAIQI